MDGPIELPRLVGTERFSAGDLTVLDFWRWAMGDLRMNTARGLLAEFLVAQAVKAPQPIRVEWAAYDVTTPDGVQIEVKSSGYFQSWRQQKPTIPVFGLTGAKNIWDPESGIYLEGQDRNVDIWVFALQACEDRDAYDPLDVDQWSFFVLPDRTVTALGQKTARLSTIRRLVRSVPWSGLSAAITDA